MAEDTHPPLPTKLLDLDPETVGWLHRLTTEERAALIWAGRLPEKKRERLDLFLALEEEKFKAGFTIVELWTRLQWIGITAMKILVTIAGALVALDAFVRWLGSGGKP